jgi:hypothetical protein
VGVEGAVSLHRSRRTLRSWSGAEESGCYLPSLSQARRHTADDRHVDGDGLGAHLFGGEPELFTPMLAQKNPNKFQYFAAKITSLPLAPRF